MSEWRFLASARWIGFAIFVVLLAGVCVRLGLWQFGKVDDRLERNTLIEAHLGSEPVPLDEVVAPGDTVDAGQEWTVVSATGRYDVDHEVTVKYMSRDGRPGVDVVTPLVLSDGTALLVDRGFIDTERTNERPEAIPEPPEGEVEVSGWLRVDSGAAGDAVRVHDGQIRAVSSVGIADDLPYDLRSGYVNLQEQTPTTDGLQAEPVPDLSQGPHFFYGLQWWFFASLAVVGYFWFARAERIERRKNAAQASAIKSA
ncbi:MAG: SURF1 family protein [Aeromicrobium sp.]|uniref:SURF1 family cytochrome oxidase biogenesis protein n=1 Tax=Aeromicrobium sp. TaxID=1871063 RepID=UPI0039E29E27